VAAKVDSNDRETSGKPPSVPGTSTTVSLAVCYPDAAHGKLWVRRPCERQILGQMSSMGSFHIWYSHHPAVAQGPLISDLSPSDPCHALYYKPQSNKHEPGAVSENRGGIVTSTIFCLWLADKTVI
jgi:hypothetical protein